MSSEIVFVPNYYILRASLDKFLVYTQKQNLDMITLTNLISQVELNS